MASRDKLSTLRLKAHTERNKRVISQFRKDYMATKKTTAKKAAPKQKIYKKTPTKQAPVKVDSGFFLIKNKTYDILNALATIILPAIATLYATIAAIWGFGFSSEVNATI
jgi:hypothetical protein